MLRRSDKVKLAYSGALVEPLLHQRHARCPTDRGGLVQVQQYDSVRSASRINKRTVEGAPVWDRGSFWGLFDGFHCSV